MTAPTVAIYVRHRTIVAATRQLSACLDRAGEEGRGVDARLIFADYGSTLSLDRPGLDGLLDAVLADRVDRLLVWDLDRITRDASELDRTLMVFANHGVTVVEVSAPTTKISKEQDR